MPELKLHLDMNASRRDLYQALLNKGHGLTRSPNQDIKQDVSDEYQLLWATSHQQIIFTFNINDYVNLAKKHPYHSGILLANQKLIHVAQLMTALDRVLTETSPEEWIGQIRWV